jgi:hypothetical protein
MFGLAVIAGACSSSPTSPAPGFDLPPTMTLRASASGEIDGLTITCELLFDAILQPDGEIIRARMAGEARRKVLDASQSGVAFIADAFYPDLRIDKGAFGSVTMTSFRDGVPDPSTGESRFWDGLNRFAGHYDSGTQSLSGTWTCRPLDTQGDRRGEVIGTWEMR